MQVQSTKPMCVAFLTNSCHAVVQIHGNVCLRAVVVTATLDWRLHGFDLLSDHAGGGDLPLMAASWMVALQYKAAEVAKSEWHVVQQSPPWAVDAWGLGCLMQEAFSGQQLARTEDLRSTAHIPPPVLQVNPPHAPTVNEDHWTSLHFDTDFGLQGFLKKNAPSLTAFFQPVLWRKAIDCAGGM